MIELNRHIEILLLDNDCVIVPDLGGFVAHHVDARYDGDDNSFLPPLRTLGFNPQLKINDSMLVQSYIEAYDISYPEAVRRIEEEVRELRQQLANEGVYELTGIGELRLNDDGNMVFDPCEAGILTPTLYALSAFEMKPLNAETEAIGPARIDGEAPVAETPREPGTITIRTSWLRNAVAAAAAIIAFLLITPPVANEQLAPSQTMMSSVELLPTPKKQVKPKEEIQITQKPVVTPEPEPVVEEAKPEPAAQAFCLVLASHVAQANAEEFVEKMQRKGYADTRIYSHNGIRRVVCGSFATHDEAYRQLTLLRSQADDFSEAWIYEIK